MNPKNTWILLVLAAGLFAFIYFFERHLHQTQIVETRVLPGLKVGAVTSVQIYPAGQLEIRANLTNGAWQLAKPLVYPAQATAIKALLQSLEELSYQAHISAQELRGRPKADEEYGFDTPRFTIIIQQGEDIWQIKLGRLTTPGDQIYLQVVGTEGVDVVSVDFLKSIQPNVDAWRDTAFVNLKDLPFDRLTITNGVKVVELQRDATNQLWRMVRPLPARADNIKIKELLSQLQNLHVTKFETDNPRADLESYGLQPDGWELSLSQGTNQVVSLQFGKSPTNDNNQVYARHNGENTLVVVPRDQLDHWRDESDKFRDRHLAGLTSAALDIIEVRGQEENFTLQRQTNDTWRITEPGNLPADAVRTHNFIQALAKLEVTPFDGEFAVRGAVTELDFPKYGLATPARKYILKRTVTNSLGGLTNLVVAELDFGSVQEDKIFARRGDRPEESSIYAVKVADFQQLPATSLAMREHRIWTFAQNDVAKVTIRQNGKLEEVHHVGPGKWSLAPGSQGLIEQLAIEMGVQELGELEAESWVEIGDQNRAKYGFSDQSLQISIELAGNGKPETLNLVLGGWSPRQLRYAAVQLEGQNWIFEVPTNVLEPLLHGFRINGNTTP
ncbi:MAG: hypothetical protein JWR19_4529 [Pedosphaera sp.]|nr:hypothetical protein [Pedosphaera sp.]